MGLDPCVVFFLSLTTRLGFREAPWAKRTQTKRLPIGTPSASEEHILSLKEARTNDLVSRCLGKLNKQ